MNAVIGQVLLWAGFLSGALATVYRVKNSENEWWTIHWPWFIGSVVCGVIGIVMYRASRQSVDREDEKVQADFGTLKPALAELLTGISSLRKELDELAPSEIIARIDSEFAEPFRVFADARESMIAEKGLAEFANVMTQFAAAERAVNRAWSAGADGYVDEVASCLERAEVLINNAHEML